MGSQRVTIIAIIVVCIPSIGKKKYIPHIFIVLFPQSANLRSLRYIVAKPARSPCSKNSLKIIECTHKTIRGGKNN